MAKHSVLLQSQGFVSRETGQPAMAGIVGLFRNCFRSGSQRHDDELARQREQLTLHIAVLAEQKSAKIIALLEQMRAESPHLSSRTDHEARAMSDAADPQQMLDAIRGAQRAAP